MTRDLFAAHPSGGVFHLTESAWAALRKTAAPHGITKLQADCRGAGTLASLLAHLGKALAFPDWYGANLDALADCLSDPDWLHQPALLTLQVDAAFARHHAAQLASLIEVFASSAEERAAAGQPLWIIIDQPHPALTPLPDA
jgi:RNAse (barnase) inhibitor barstar